MNEQIVDLVEAVMPSSSDAVAAARGAGGAAGMEAGRVAAASLAGDVRDRVNTLSSRVDVLAASGSDGGDVGTELRDVRVGADGKSYASAGQAVRSQFGMTVRSMRNVELSGLASPYDDLDTLPDDSVVTYTFDFADGNVAHAPSSSSLETGTVITCNGTGDDTGGTVQILVGRSGRMATRSKWYANGVPSWSGWHEYATPEDVTGMAVTTLGRFINLVDGAAPEPYDDMDDLPANTVVTYAFDWAGLVAHAPEGDGYQTGTVLTVAGATGIPAGTVQVAACRGGLMATRVCWSTGGKTTWSPWAYPSYADPSTLVPEYEYGSLSMFERIGVIGDSFASGEIYMQGAEHGTDHYSLSWGQNIARMCGVSCVNFSKGGMHTRWWLTDDRGLPMLKSEPAQNLYMLALGINDQGKLGTSYLGTPDDMRADHTENPDTFYGNYARIIAEIKNRAPSSKIVIMTMASTGGTYDAYNTAIETIAEHEGIPLIRQLDDPFFTSDFYRSMVGGHPTAVTYAGMAKAIMRLFSRCAIQYKTYFDDYTGND